MCTAQVELVSGGAVPTPAATAAAALPPALAAAAMAAPITGSPSAYFVIRNMFGEEEKAEKVRERRLRWQSDRRGGREGACMGEPESRR